MLKTPLNKQRLMSPTQEGARDRVSEVDRRNARRPVGLISADAKVPHLQSLLEVLSSRYVDLAGQRNLAGEHVGNEVRDAEIGDGEERGLREGQKLAAYARGGLLDLRQEREGSEQPLRVCDEELLVI